MHVNNSNSQPITEQRNAQSEGLELRSIAEIVRLMNQEDQSVPLSVQKALPQIEAAIGQIVRVMNDGGRLFYIGAGTSGRLGILDASECPPTFGVSPELVTGIIAGGDAAIKTAIENAEDNFEAGRRDIAAHATARDAVVGITASGRTPYVLGAIEEAKRIGAVTVGVSCNPGTLLSAASEYPIEIPVGPEVVTGSTRLKAGTAQKLVLNMITTTTMIKLGKVYGNLMVNVQATNAKLRERVIRIVQEATGADAESARSATEQVNGDASAAILMIKFGLDAQEAIDALQRANGHFTKAMNHLNGNGDLSAGSN